MLDFLNDCGMSVSAGPAKEREKATMNAAKKKAEKKLDEAYKNLNITSDMLTDVQQIDMILLYVEDPFERFSLLSSFSDDSLRNYYYKYAHYYNHFKGYKASFGGYPYYADVFSHLLPEKLTIQRANIDALIASLPRDVTEIDPSAHSEIVSTAVSSDDQRGNSCRDEWCSCSEKPCRCC
jgi:hypothetical protein